MIYARIQKYYSPRTDGNAYVRTYMFVRGLESTKAMNTGCGIDSNDGLNALKIAVVKRKRRLQTVVCYTNLIRRRLIFVGYKGRSFARFIRILQFSSITK